ncbi:MAG: hypothetical protein MUF18_04245 [Fimbriiglobus sp.]|jgi:hypothetical protein|nr:hypothetical protein [Fimbriiglobus sp.]
MNTLVRLADLGRLHARTMYPLIPSYHPPDPDTGELGPALPRPIGDVIATEFIDGINTRIVVFADGSYLIGHPQRWLYAGGDVIGDAAMGVVKAVRPLAERLSDSAPVEPDTVLVVYGEMFGGKTPAAARYTARKEVGYRTTDVAVMALHDDAERKFLPEKQLLAFTAKYELPLVPRVARFPARDLPNKPTGVLTLLEEVLPSSRCRLDADADAGPAGLIVRTVDRGWVASLRFDDYRRAKKRKRKSGSG